MSRPDRDFVGIAEVVRSLRAQLLTAHEEADQGGVYFEMGPVEVEFALEVVREGGGEVGFDIGVVSVGGSGSVSRDSTHRMKFMLTPMDGITGKPLLVAGRVDEIPDR